MSSSWIGKKLSDRYEIIELLGQGGMSSVYRAEDPNLRRTVAVKMIHPHLSSDSNFVSRFEEEASSVAQLRNSNIIQVYDFSNDGDTYYMVLEFVPGETLATQLERLEKSDRRMPIRDVIKYTANICDALEYAHTRGLIHRDIKPANIMLNVEGEAILMDFGIAKIVGGKQHTATGAVVGTALYMAPEVIKGEPADPRADIYSLGVTLFESLTGKPPFEADSALSILMMHVNDPVPDLREINQDVPDALVAVVKKALAKDKEDRFRSAAEFAQALRAIDLSAPARVDATAVEEPQAVILADRTMIEEPGAVAQPGATMIEDSGGTEDYKPVDAGAIPPPPAGPGSAAGGRKGGLPMPLLVGGGFFGLFVVIVAIILGARLFRSGGLAAADTPTPTIPVPSATIEPTATETLAPTNTAEPTFTPTATDPPGPYVRINEIRLENGTYIVEYDTFGYTEVLPGTHIHFFFDTVPPEQAGYPGGGPWYLWGGPRPFDKYTVSDRPAAATQMCALQANPNHSVNYNTGNCVDLPSE